MNDYEKLLVYAALLVEDEALSNTFLLAAIGAYVETSAFQSGWNFAKAHCGNGPIPRQS